jgi:hypothetical protein
LTGAAPGRGRGIPCWYPPSLRPGKAGFRKLEVRVGRPGVEVRARQGYFVAETGEDCTHRERILLTP